MFARTFNRTARIASSQIRYYASEAPKSSSNTLLYGGVGAAASVGAYYYLQQSDAKSISAAANPAKLPAEAKKIFTGGDQGFVSLKLEDVENLSHNTKRLRFSLGDDDAISGVSVASALLTKYKGPEMEKPVIRPYTPTSDEDARGFLEFVIKRYPDGPMSSHLHEMSPGQRLDIKGPLPKYKWEENKHDHIALIAGGTGITPMYQLCRAIFKNPNEKTKVTLVFGNVREEDILLREEFARLENEYPNRFRAFYVLNSPPESWQQGKGFITKELLQTVLPKPDQKNVKAFICGPPGLYKAISGTKKSPQDQGELSGYLKELGWSKDQVYKF